MRSNYNDKYEDIRKRWGGGIMGPKAQAVKAKIEKLKAKEIASKMSAWFTKMCRLVHYRNDDTTFFTLAKFEWNKYSFFWILQVILR